MEEWYRGTGRRPAAARRRAGLPSSGGPFVDEDGDDDDGDERALKRGVGDAAAAAVENSNWRVVAFWGARANLAEGRGEKQGLSRSRRGK